MKIGILSDIHDNLPRLRDALERLNHCETLLCCGDLCSPFVVKELGNGFKAPIHIVFGNNDGDLYRITQVAARFGQIILHGEMAELELGGKRFGLNHYDLIGRVFADSGRYDVVCFGHNHRFEISRVRDALVINPGEVLGGLSGQSTCVEYDSGSATASRIDL